MKDRILSKKEISQMKVRSKVFYKKNKKYVLLKVKKRRIKVMKEWEKVIPRKTVCSICNKKIYFRHKNRLKSIHFDHRHGGKEPIKCAPSTWLQSNRLNEKSLSKWKQSDFGILCNWCNRFIPTRNRLQWLKKVTKYIKG